MWGRLGLQCLKTVKSEVIAMWVEWAKEMQVEKKKIWHQEWFWLSAFF